jgi:hypothetical protein
MLARGQKLPHFSASRQKTKSAWKPQFRELPEKNKGENFKIARQRMTRFFSFWQK